MKENIKAFTMVEMLGVIVIIALISLFSFPVINSLSNSSKQEKYKKFVDILTNAADTYVELNFEKYDNTSVQYINASKLIKEGLLDENLTNPKTKTKVITEDGVIVISKNSDRTISYEYVLNEYITISYIEDLVELANNVSNGNTYSGKIIILSRNLDFKDTNSYKDSSVTTYGNINEDVTTSSLLVELTTGKGFNPIGDATHAFSGTFVGDNYKISNLYINRQDEENTGLFSTLNNAKISGLILNGEVNGANYTGLLAGKMNGSQVVDFKGNSKINYTCISCNVSNIGGFIGYINQSSLVNIISTHDINIGTSNIGGFAGTIENSTVNSLTTNGAIKAESSIGGVFGTVTSTTLNTISSTGKVIGTDNVGGVGGVITSSTTVNSIRNNASVSGDNKVGGLIGISSGSTISYGINSGSVSGVNETGGLVGTISGTTIEKSYSSTSVTGDIITGGLIGTATSSNLNNCYNWGDIKATTKVGGLIGSMISSQVNNSYTISNITATNEVGALVGIATNSSQINNSYYNSDKTMQNVLVGTNTSLTNNGSSSLYDSEMKIQASYNSWNFSTIWQINGSYPILR